MIRKNLPSSLFFAAVVMIGLVSDSGRSWHFYVIDTSAFEANGNFLEVRPDEVIFMYGGSYSPKGNRMQLIKVDRQRQVAWPIPIGGEAREKALRAGPVDAVRQKVTLDY